LEITNETKTEIMKAITKNEFRNLEAEKIGEYTWYIKGANLNQEVALYERITRDLKKIYQIVN
jgi:hypothetical protein